MLANDMVLIILQCINVSNKHIIYHKLTQWISIIISLFFFFRDRHVLMRHVKQRKAHLKSCVGQAWWRLAKSLRGRSRTGNGDSLKSTLRTFFSLTSSSASLYLICTITSTQEFPLGKNKTSKTIKQ